MNHFHVDILYFMGSNSQHSCSNEIQFMQRNSGNKIYTVKSDHSWWMWYILWKPEFSFMIVCWNILKNDEFLLKIFFLRTRIFFQLFFSFSWSESWLNSKCCWWEVSFKRVFVSVRKRITKWNYNFDFWCNFLCLLN